MTTSLLSLAAQWPADLLIDYILKVHHRGIRAQGPDILNLFRTVAAEAPTDTTISEACRLFNDSLLDLDLHLMKEEQVLFPFILDLFDASEQEQTLEPMHCGSVANPIHVMVSDHEGELERYAAIARLTHDFAVPAGSSAAYAELMPRLRTFMEALHEHIALENDLLFPRAQRLEAEWVR